MNKELNPLGLEAPQSPATSGKPEEGRTVAFSLHGRGETWTALALELDGERVSRAKVIHSSHRRLEVVDRLRRAEWEFREQAVDPFTRVDTAMPAGTWAQRR